MNRALTITTVTLALLAPTTAANAARRPAPKPVRAVTITSATEVCGKGGYTSVTVDATATVAGTFDVSLWGDGVQSPGWVDEVTLTPGVPFEGTYWISYPAQIDAVLTDVAGARVAERAVPAASSCTQGW